MSPASPASTVRQTAGNQRPGGQAGAGGAGDRPAIAAVIRTSALAIDMAGQCDKGGDARRDRARIKNGHTEKRKRKEGEEERKKKKMKKKESKKERKKKK